MALSNCLLIQFDCLTFPIPLSRCALATNTKRKPTPILRIAPPLFDQLPTPTQPPWSQQRTRGLRSAVIYIGKINKRGFAYSAIDSVYFDISKFDGCPNHFYTKLVPDGYDVAKALQEEKGDQSVTEDRLS
jgi:hypothetical protein